MRKKCVLWAKPVLTSLTIILAVGLRWSDVTLSAQSSPDPSTLPRLQFADFTYRGAFRMPRTVVNGEDFSYGALHLAYNPARNSLFGSSLHNNVAEVTIPTPVITTDINQLPAASYLQGFTDPTEGHFREVEQGGPNPAVLSGLLVRGNRLYASGSIYYDAQNSQVVSHFSHSTNLSEPSFSGWSQVWEAGKVGFVAGYMAHVPSEWQSALGGPALTGQCCIPIISRTSYGPGAFAFDPSNIGGNSVIPASPLLYYKFEHATLGPWEGSNPTYGATTGMGGVAVIAGTRTVLFIGRNGLGNYCYGHGVADAALDGTKASDGQSNCYDPTSSDKGMHAYPYRYQIWAYDLADFAAVKAGTKQPWEVVPYGVWPFDLPTQGATARIGGVAYDAQRQLLYIAQDRADVEGYSARPLIHVLQVNATPGSVDPSVPTVPLVPPPAPSTPVSTSAPPATLPVDPPSSQVVSAITLSAKRQTPQLSGTGIAFTAFATGGVSPQEYKWLVDDGDGMKAVTGWSVVDAFTWTPAWGGSYRVGVWARSNGNTTDAPEASASTSLNITGPPRPGPALTITATTVDAGAVIQVVVSNGPATRQDWVSIAATSAADTVYDDWKFLNGTRTAPATGVSATTLQFLAPSKPGTYHLRFFANNGFTKLATSATFVVAGPTITVAATTVKPGSVIQFAVSNGPANRRDWVSIAPVGAADTVCGDWKYLNGTRTAPSAGVSRATVQLTVPTTPGTYQIRLFADHGFTRLASSATVTIAP